jgi:LuxR family transcriptional regulator, maltose regulon positive regulatory protein
MHPEDLLLRTKLMPPRLQRRLLPRPALLKQLREALDYRLTLVQAGTGYGKTTALASLDTGDIPLCWYSVEEADADPQRFLAYLIAAFDTRLPGLSDLPRAILQDHGRAGDPNAWSQTIDALINALAERLEVPTLLVVDDYHFVAASPKISALIERFIGYLPADLHVILATRHPLASAPIATLRTRGEALVIDDAALSFRAAEIEALFQTTYGLRLSAQEVAALADKTDGWPIALQLVWQDLRDNAAQSASDLLTRGPAALGALFDYLAREVLAQQPVEIATFLRETAVLRELTPAACDAVRDDGRWAMDDRQAESDAPSSIVHRLSSDLLAQLHNQDLFVVALGERHYRYHHLFHDFLREQAAADPDGVRTRHQRAAAFFESRGDDEEAIGHWLAAGHGARAAAAIERAGEATLQAGRFDTVAQWVDAISADVLAERPRLQVYRGDVFRMRSRFDTALKWYALAERTFRGLGDSAGVSRALRGQASVYLDTVRPAEAERLLEEALRLSDGMADRAHRARLLELLAENKLNLGHPDEAGALQAQAHALREEGPDEDIVSVRVRFRTGRLAEARSILETWVTAERRAAERGPVRPPRAHRETLLLLSITYAFLGMADAAIATGREGVALGERLQSPFISAVAHTRLGHALLLRRDTADAAAAGHARDEALRCFHAALALGDRQAVRRARVEAMWGLTRAYGFFGDCESARRAATEGIELARQDGDAWFVAMIELALGSSYQLAGRPDMAIPILSRALVTLRECGDNFGRAAARLWLGLSYTDLQQDEHFATCAEALLELCETHDYALLFTAPSMLGPPDRRRLVPLLLRARARQIRPAYVAQLLAAIGMPDMQIHPGYQLRVQTLGAFRVWRGDVEIEPREWQRDKARQLVQLLLTQRGRWLQREEIVDRLWPDLAPEVVGRDFKVALNAMNRALEPARAQEAAFAYVAREGTTYRFRPEADVWIDAVAFEQSCENGLRLTERHPTNYAPDAPPDPAIEQAISSLRAALNLYEGDYLPDALYEDWATEERDRLLTLYLRGADRLAGLLIDGGHNSAAIDICQRILARDPCWERAYRLAMFAHTRQGNRSLALRTYQRCASALCDELGIDPGPATMRLHEQIVRGEEPPVTLV